MRYFDSCPNCGFTGKSEVYGCKNCATLFCVECGDNKKCKSCNYRGENPEDSIFTADIFFYETIGKIGKNPVDTKWEYCSGCEGTGEALYNKFLSRDVQGNTCKCPRCGGSGKIYY